MEYIIELVIKYLDMVILFSASFLLVGLLGLQSKNVQGSKYAAAALTSIAITVANFFFIRLVVNDTGYTTLVVAGLGGALGIVSAIYLYDRATERSKKRKSSYNYDGQVRGH
tara:strand:+ start:177 stop:512 length:336 start_codon:yes stop_codon:yes gene_type:complete